MSVCSFCDHRNDAGRARCVQCGAELPVDPATLQASAARRELTGLDAELAQLLERDGKIAAIKRHREATGQGLKESKDAVERLARRIGLESTGKGCAGMLLLGVLFTGYLVANVL